MYIITLVFKLTYPPVLDGMAAQAGEYNITVTISGEAGTSLPVSRSIQVARPLTLDTVDLTLPDLVVWPPGDVTLWGIVRGEHQLMV